MQNPNLICNIKEEDMMFLDACLYQIEEKFYPNFKKFYFFGEKFHQILKIFNFLKLILNKFLLFLSDFWSAKGVFLMVF